MADTPVVASLAIPPVPDRDDSLSAVTIRGAFRSLLRDPSARVALAFLGVLVVAAVAAPWVAPFDPIHQPDAAGLKLMPPSASHWMGTDQLSRDVLSRMIFGARISLSVGALAAALSSVLGLLVGGVAGFVGGRVDGLLMRMVDALLAIPRVLLLITVLALWGEVDLTALVVLLGGTGWFAVARLARAEAAALRGREFVIAARALGASPLRVFVRHVLPHAAGPVIVSATLAIAHVIVMEAGLSYLGYGLRAPTPTWGNIIRDAGEAFTTAWWLTLFPGLALVGTAVAVNTVADRLRMALNPRQLPAR